jgi:uncharacterized membrane protein YjjP (DUF1212 family)
VVAIAKSLKHKEYTMENAMDEMRELRMAMARYERNGEFIKAGLIHQLYAELYARFNNLPVGEYWNLS